MSERPAPGSHAAEGWGGQFGAVLALPGRTAALLRLSEWVHEVARANALPDGCAFRLELVLTEIVTNIIDHADPPAGDGAIELRIACEPGRVLAQVEDAGRPFDPTTAPAHSQPGSLAEAQIGGLGVHLIRAYSQQLTYDRMGNRNRLRLALACDA